MSLGITAIWRVRPQHRLGLLIPREPFLFNGLPTHRSSPRLSPGPLLNTGSGVSYFNTAQDPSPSVDEDEADAGADAGAEAEAGVDIDRAHADELPTSSPPTTAAKATGRSDEPLLGHKNAIRFRRVTHSKNELQKLEQSLERSHFVKSVLVEHAKIYPHMKETREGWRDHHKSVSAQVHFQRSRRQSLDLGLATGPNNTDWRWVLGLLGRHTPEQPTKWIEDGIKVELPERVFALIMDEGGDTKVGAIRKRTGVTIKASRGEEPGGRPSVLLSGTRQAINKATEELRSIAGPVIVTRLVSPLAPGELQTDASDRKVFFVPPLTREEGGPFRRYKVDYNISTVPWPDTMSHHTFEQFVASLTDSVVLPHLHSELYPSTKRVELLDHERAVARQLKRAFTRDRVRPWVSCSALKTALSFLCEKGDKYLPEARSIFVSMDQYGLHMDADIYNILLKAPTKTRNLRKFQQTLLVMTRRGLAPNLDTWILFLRIIESVEVKSYILRAMHMKNLLGTSEAIRRVAEEMARFDAGHAAQHGKGLNTFIQEQDERYGPEWLSRDPCNLVLDVLCRYGRYSDAFKLLNRMHERADTLPIQLPADTIATRPDVVSYNTIMSHAKRHGKLNIMINTIRKMKTIAYATQPDSTSLHLLFEMAWHLHMRATVSAIWRYAALARLTTWRMRVRVAALLSWKPGETDRLNTYGISPSAYRDLGGENLARDLAGGKAALDKIRSIAAGRNRAELAVLAAKVWPQAFNDFGPTVSLANTLSQAASRDRAFFQAQKQGGEALRKFRVQTKPKILPLKERRPFHVGWTDLAPLDNVDPDWIVPEDGWEELKNLNVLLGPPREREGLNINDRFGKEVESGSDEKVDADGQSSKERGLIQKVMGRREMVIMDSGLWAVNEAASANEQPRPPGWSALQTVNEKDILAALEELEKRYSSVQADEPMDKEFEAEWEEVEGVSGNHEEADRGALDAVEGGGNSPLPVQDDVIEGLTGHGTQENVMTDHVREEKDPSEVSDTDIVKRIDHEG